MIRQFSVQEKIAFADYNHAMESSLNQIVFDVQRRLALAAEARLRIMRKEMHYRDGRKANNGDKIVQLDDHGRITAVGILYDAVPGNDYCNGKIAPIQSTTVGACLIDCLHIDNVADRLISVGLGSRPANKY